MTGMEHAIEQVAQRLHSSYCECEGWYPECQGAQVGDRRVARRLAAEGLLAPAPLTEEWAVQWVRRGGEIRTYPCDDEADARGSIRGDETTVHRYVSDWLPVDRTEGDERGGCACAHCDRRPIMHICPDCGSKRCPRAAHHDNPCDRRSDQ